MTFIQEKFDIAVIGGGPAGIMAAIKAGESGARVVLLEKNNNLGKKLLLTGNGRCNLTHAEFNHKMFANEFGKNGDFLMSGFSVFGPKETMDFFEKKGLKLKTERGKRVFPQSDKASDVLNILDKYLKKNNVVVVHGCKISGLRSKDKNITSIVLQGKEKLIAQKYILATGGKSYTQTGSTGDGFIWAKKLGHNVSKLRPALVPLKVKEKWIKNLQGLGLKNIELSVFQDNKKKDSMFGEMMFTHLGISGPIVLGLSKNVAVLLEKNNVDLVLDLKPKLNFQELDKRIQHDFAKYQNKLFRNCLKDLLPSKIIPVIIMLSGIDPSKKVNRITKQERQSLLNLLKGLKMTATGTLKLDKAIVTNGGISVKEIESKTMRSKLFNNLYFAGEIIDLDGPSGGYNLQLCWTSGYLAGMAAAKV